MSDQQVDTAALDGATGCSSEVWKLQTDIAAALRADDHHTSSRGPYEEVGAYVENARAVMAGPLSDPKHRGALFALMGLRGPL